MSRKVWTRQPPSHVRSTKAANLANGLLLLAGRLSAGGASRSVADRNYSLTLESGSGVSYDLASSNFGVLIGVSAASKFDSLNFPATSLNSRFSETGAATVLLYLRSTAQDAVGNSGPWNLVGVSPSLNEHYPYTDGNIYIGPFSNTRWVAAAPGTDLTKPHVTVATHKSGEQKCYVNGTLIASAAIAETPALGAARIASNGAVYCVAIWDRVLSSGEIADVSRNPWQLFAPRNEPTFFLGPAAGSGITSGSLVAADGSSISSALTGSSTASSGATQATGVSTTAAISGTGITETVVSAAAGTSTAASLVGVGLALSTASFTQADGASIAGTLTGSSTFSGTLGQANGVSTVSAQTGASTASTTASSAAGVSTTGTLSSDGATTASFGAAAGVSTVSVLAGSSIAAAAISPAAGVSTTANLETNGVATQTRGGMSTNQKKRRKRLLKAPEIPETVKALILDLTAAKPIPEARVTKAVTEIALLQADPSLERLKSDLKSLLEQVKKLPITPEVITDSQEPEEPSETLAVAELTQKVETLQKDVSNLHKKLDNVLKAITKLEDVLIAINS